MAIRKWWAGLMGPFLYDDSVAAFRFETAAGTVEIGSFAGQDSASVDINGGEIDGATLGAGTSLISMQSEEIILDGATLPLTLQDAGTTAATELGWVEVLVGGTTGYIRVYSAK